ncbi:AI-2E family transporter [Colwellia echini]|uniref:AI-2E family transporter n=1 Tax=Colwellia echini TaxID=1982103 RepID=A0ABY3MZM7_9GAMM|nr:AI-2E family transporter [Colwellia echini]TYK66680.1 AI-2E family transporter [Colwellia echini]
MKTKLLAKRTFIQASTTILVVLLAWMFVDSSKIILTGFGGVLIAVLFCGSAEWLSNKTNLSRKIWLPVTIIVPLLLFGLFLLYTAPKLAEQASELKDRLPQAISYIQEQISGLQWPDKIVDNVKELSSYDPEVSTIVNVMTSFFSSTMNGLGSIVFALFLALFLSVNPKLYIKGAVSLVPPLHRERVKEAFEACGSALSGWLVAKIASMLMVGILTTLGLWALGTDLALILGIIAALLSFIPNIGPIIGYIPAALVSVITGVDTLIYVTILYVGIQVVESYILTPVLQAKIANLPPALTLFAQVLLASMVGMAGVLLAAPLVVTVMVLVKMLYIEDLLETKTTE